MAAVAWASRTNRSRTPVVPDSSGRMTFSATGAGELRVLSQENEANRTLSDQASHPVMREPAKLVFGTRRTEKLETAAP